VARRSNDRHRNRNIGKSKTFSLVPPAVPLIIGQIIHALEGREMESSREAKRSDGMVKGRLRLAQQVRQPRPWQQLKGLPNRLRLFITDRNYRAFGHDRTPTAPHHDFTPPPMFLSI